MLSHEGVVLQVLLNLVEALLEVLILAIEELFDNDAAFIHRGGKHHKVVWLEDGLFELFSIAAVQGRQADVICKVVDG